MLNINFIRENPEAVKEGIAKKNIDPKFVDRFLRLDEEWRLKTKALDELQREQNRLSKELATNKAEALFSQAQVLKQRTQHIGEERKKIAARREEILGKFPNLPFADVPVGPDESHNVLMREAGEKPTFDFPALDYLTLAEKLGIIDVVKAAAVAGSRFGYLFGDAALLEFGLVKLAFETLVPHGFIPVVPPVMIRPEVFRGMGRLAADQKQERYHLTEDDLYLVGSAEHTLGPIHMDDVLHEETLPRRYVGFSTCFRREAGSHGKDTKGILRVHQFDKVEMFSFTAPEQSRREHEFLLGRQEELMQKLRLPYRVLEICTGDMGWTDAKQYDIEVWLPGQGTYRETHSASNTTDFQGRGINVRYKPKKGEIEVAHLLNATAFAIGRTLIAIIENYQTKNGTIRVPDVLQAFVGKEEIK